MLKEFIVHKVDRYANRFVQQPTGSFKLFVSRRPADPHGGSVLQNHVFSDGSICVAAGKEPRTMDRAEAVAHMWMTGYSAYIRDPQGRFANKACRVNV